METTDTPRMSLMEKMTNIFASPGELFEDVRITPPTPSNWAIPMILFIVVALAMGQLVMQNATLVDQLATVIRAGMERGVQEGRMTQEQMEQAYEFARPGSTWSMVGQAVGIVVVIPILLFLMGLIYWLLGKWAMGASAPYMKVVEVVGLTFFIGIVENIVTTILMFLLDSIYATPSLALAVLREYDIENKLHLVLSKFNIFTFWNLTVLSIGLSKLFQRHLPKVLVLVFALWVLWSVFSILTGFRLGG